MSEATLGSCQLRFVVYVGIHIIVRALWGQRSLGLLRQQFLKLLLSRLLASYIESES